ncbi:hypothetical protein FRB99_002620 [Tulasnella sp. 403]|nr:hypothetical protein FRB99_002620 [Tulasnella sp. 403]
MSALTYDAAHLIGVFIGLLIFGFYVATYCATVYHIRRRASKSSVVLAALTALLVLTSGYYVLASYAIYLAFVPYRVSPGVLYRLNFYGDPFAPSKDILYMLSMLVADSLLVWRLFIIWPENRVALVAAVVLLCGVTGCGFVISLFEIFQTMVQDSRYVVRVYHWTVAASALIITENVLVTTCIAARLWWMSHQIAILGKKASSLYNRISYVMIQSGALYLSCIVAQLVLFATQQRSVIYLYIHMSPALVAFFPTLIVLQLNLESRKRPGPQTLSNWALAVPESIAEDSVASTTLPSHPGHARALTTHLTLDFTTIAESEDIELGLILREKEPPAESECLCPTTPRAGTSRRSSRTITPSL